MQKNKQSTETKLKTRIPNGLWVVILILLVSVLPYLNELLTVKTEEGAQWANLFGLNRFLPDVNSRVLGFSKYRVFIYTLCTFVFSTMGYYTSFRVSSLKHYHMALLIPLFTGAHQIVMILANIRGTWVNSWEAKTSFILILFAMFFLIENRKDRFTIRKTLTWILILLIAFLPFFHDIITDRPTAELREWVPKLGIENYLKDSDGYVLGFKKYRTFVYYLMLHLYAHLGWLLSFIYYNHSRKKIKPFLLVPLIISLFSLMLFILNIQETPFGAPDIKFYITIIISLILTWNLYFNDKTNRDKQLDSNKNTT